jgi:replicative DNA helicase
MSNKKNIELKDLPQSSNVEKIVLGTILVDSTVIDRIISSFSANLFLDVKHKTIAYAIIDLYKANTSIDMLTLVNQLKHKDKLELVGGIGFISSLTKDVGSSANVDFHIKILAQEALRRNLIQIGTSTIQKSFDDTNDIFDVFAETQIALDTSMKEVVNYEIKKVGQIHDSIIKESISILKTGQKSGVESGLKMLDNVTNGWQKSDLVIVAGRPGMGKSSLVVSMSLHPAVNQDIPVAIFSLEMSSEQIVGRMQAYYSEINVSRIVKKQLNEDDIVTIERRTEGLKKAPIYIDDTPNISLIDLKGKVRKLVKESNVQLVIIDYLQLMRSGMKTQSREQEIAEISRGLKALAKEQNIPIIALSQLSRAVEATGDKKPMLSHLRESGAIEQDADMVMFCFRPEYYDIEQYEVGIEQFDTHGLFMLIIAKHRNGELGEIPLTFIHELTKLTNHEYSNSYNSNKNSTFVQQSNNATLMIETTSNAIKPNSEFETREEFSLDSDDEIPF